MAFKYDFSGWASSYGIRCADGRTIMHDAFKANHGKRVPLVYMHDHKDNLNVLGFAVLENRPEGVYAYVSCNGTERGKNAKAQVAHGDLTAMSIFANELDERGDQVFHGNIKELSLVLAGANKKAIIDRPIIHFEDGTWEYNEDAPEDEFILMMPSDDGVTLSHGGILEGYDEYGYPEENYIKHGEKDMAKKTRSLSDIVEGLDEEDQNVIYRAFGYVAEHADEFVDNDDEEDDEDYDEEDDEDYEDGLAQSDMGGNMSYNLFEQQGAISGNGMISRAQYLQLQHDSIADVGNFGGSLKKSFIAHAAEYGIESIDFLFPEYQRVNGKEPEILNYDQEWVDVVMKGVSHSPFMRIRMDYADITEQEARAKGYFKGDRKEEEVFGLLRREVRPTTIYAKQKLDKQDIDEITDFDVAAFVKRVGTIKLNEETARAILFGDGRSPLDHFKVREDCIIPIVKEDPLFCIKYTIPNGVAGDGYTAEEKTAMNVIRGAIKSRKGYRGSGNPTMFMTEDLLSDMLLLTDKDGRDLYDSEQKLATKMRVSKIKTIPDEIFPSNDIYAVIVNLNDYRVGAKNNGQVSLFQDFDIDFNQEKYLREVTMSGALVKPFSAIVLKKA